MSGRVEVLESSDDVEVEEVVVETSSVIGGVEVEIFSVVVDVSVVDVELSDESEPDETEEDEPDSTEIEGVLVPLT